MQHQPFALRRARLSSALLSSFSRFVCLFCCTLLTDTSNLSAATGAAPAASAPADDSEDAESETAQPKKTSADDPAAKPYWEALKLFRDGKDADWKRGRELLEESADLEFTHAQNALGSFLLNGSHGYRQNRKKAVTLFELAASRNNGFAALNLGLCYFSGMGVRSNQEAASQWLELVVSDKADFTVPPPPEDFAASAKGSDTSDATLSGSVPIDPADSARATAHLVLGEIRTAQRQLDKAHRHYVAAATAGPNGRAGRFQAAIKAATNFAFGHGVARDLAKANEMLEQSKKLNRRFGMVFAHALVEGKALDDFAQADLEEEISAATEKMQHEFQSNIAGSFADPKSKEYNPQEAAKWYELAAEAGDPWPMLSLAFLHSEGRLGAPDPAKAFHYFKMAAEKGNHTLGFANLAICHLHGLGTEKDPAKAAEIFAKYSDDEIVCYLGTIGQAPASVVTYDQALELNKSWAKKKDAHANYLLARRYHNGWGVEQSLDEAGRYFERAAKANHARAMCEFGVLYEHPAYRYDMEWDNKYKRSSEWFRKSAEAGNAYATANLAYNTSLGRGVPKNEAQAAALYEKALAIDPTLARALNNLGAIYSDRFDAALKGGDAAAIELNKRRMLECYEAAEKLNYPLAAQNLGFLMYQGRVGKPDFEKAYAYFTTAAEGGQTTSRRMLGIMHEKGEGVPVTLREAAYHYRLAALNGDQIALVSLCDFYLLGKGVSRDFDRASYWLMLLGQMGDGRAIVALGDIALKQKDYANARKLFLNLLFLESPMLNGYANERLSRMYQYGWGVTANPKRAARYHRKAVELGDKDAIYRSAVELMRAGKKAEARPLLEKAAESNAAAKYSLGHMHLTGTAGLNDVAKGWSLIRESAEAGNPDAQIALAAAALKNIPGAPTLKQAIQLAESAESSGHPNAKPVREQLEARRKQ